jgi:hypothetical protein
MWKSRNREHPMKIKDNDIVMQHLVFEEIGSLNEINDLTNQYLDELLDA